MDRIHLPGRHQADMMTAMMNYNPVAISLFTISWTIGKKYFKMQRNHWSFGIGRDTNYIYYCIWSISSVQTPNPIFICDKT